MTDKAFGTTASGTSRIMVAAESVQKPPSAMPSSTRPASSMARLDAIATRRFEKIRRTERPSSTSRRSILRVTTVISRLVTSATAAVAVTAWPAMPSEILRSAAIGVSRLAGRNSAPTSPNTPNVIDITAPQAGRASASLCGAAFVASVI